MSTRRGLGKGLGALIPSAPVKPATPSQAARPVEHAPVIGESSDGAAIETSDTPTGATEPVEARSEHDDPAVNGAVLVEVPVDQIETNPRQPRQVFDEEALAELSHSIKEVGLLQPVVVRRQPSGGYLLIMGERRLRASKDAGLDVIPAIVRETGDDDLLRDALLENLHRVQLNPLEEAAAYSQLLEDFGCTHDVLAERIGRSRPQITNTIRLLKLPPTIQRRVAAGVLSAGHARALLMVSGEARQEHLAHRVVAEGLSVRALEELVALDEQPEKKQKKVSGPTPVAPKVVDLQDRLSDRFETRVKVNLGRSKGKITVEFASVDDLERIVDLMDPRRQ